MGVLACSLFPVPPSIKYTKSTIQRVFSENKNQIIERKCENFNVQWSISSFPFAIKIYTNRSCVKFQVSASLSISFNSLSTNTKRIHIDWESSFLNFFSRFFLIEIDQQNQRICSCIFRAEMQSSLSSSSWTSSPSIEYMFTRFLFVGCRYSCHSLWIGYYRIGARSQKDRIHSFIGFTRWFDWLRECMGVWVRRVQCIIHINTSHSRAGAHKRRQAQSKCKVIKPKSSKRRKNASNNKTQCNEKTKK